MGRDAVLLVILLYSLLLVGRIQCTRSVSTKEDLDKEIHLNLLNKPSISIIRDKYGDFHDCVDVYKQVAFDHPLLKKHTIDFQIRSNPFNDKVSKRNSSTLRKSLDTFSKTEMCPVRTIPVRRISITKLLGERHIIEAKETETTNRHNTYLAIARTKAGSNKFSGVGGRIKIDNPKVVGQQFSATRIRLQAGSDSIEAGWRVDPSLYGDSQTRLFIRTDAGRAHCFNTQCPGFIQTYHGHNLDKTFDDVSVPGGYVYDVGFYIIRDNRSGNWNFIFGRKSTMIGYWPPHIFTGLKHLADRVEWGGAAFSPPGTPLPPMGSGNHPVGSPLWDGSIRQIKVLNEKGQKVDTYAIETYASNSKLYSVRDDGFRGEEWGHTILYGGPGHQ